MNKLVLGLTFALTAGASSLALCANPSEASHHHPMGMETTMAMPAEAAGPMNDPRRLVEYPEPMRIHTLANMRDHLLTLQKIQEDLAQQNYDLAANVAEQRLGMSAMALDDAGEVAKYMPKGMQEAGMAMHRSASQFALAAGNASATGDVKPALEALSNVTAHCVACHAAYRLK